MNKLILILTEGLRSARLGALMLAMVLSAVGCSASVQPPQAPKATAAEPAPEVGAAKPDNFDKAGKAAADGSRWVWNGAKGIWERVTSKENKDRASHAWKTTKAVVSGAIDAAKRAYDEHNPDEEDADKK